MTLVFRVFTPVYIKYAPTLRLSRDLGKSDARYPGASRLYETIQMR